MLRCPKCKNVIKLDELGSATETDHNLLTLNARLATRAEISQLRQTIKQPVVREKVIDEPEVQQTQSLSDKATVGKASERPVAEKQETSPASEPVQGKPESRWRMPKSRSGSSDREQQLEKKLSPTTTNTSTSTKTTNTSSGSDASAISTSAGKRQIESSSAVFDAQAATTADETPQQLRVGVTHSRDLTAKSTFLAAALFITGLLMILPTISSFVSYAQSDAEREIPRWAAWMVFGGMLHIVYCFYAAQLADWTSIKMISVFMLLVTFISAILLAGLALSPPGGFVSRVFQIPFSLTMKAEIWLLTMLAISSSIGYLSGREAFRWKQLENQMRKTV
jgi:hypothetical protein